MSMFIDISWGSEDKNSTFLSTRRDLAQDNGHSSYVDQKRNGLLSVKTVHKVNGTESLRR